MKVGLVAMCLALSVKAGAQPPGGAEFPINTYSLGHQRDARVAVGPGGDFVVVWTSEGQDGDRMGIFGQRFGAAGEPIGGEFRVNVATIGSQTEPAVALAHDSGDFVVVWTTAQSFFGDGIRGRRFDASGTPVGAEFGVNSSTGSFHANPRVGRAADGSFIVVWTSYVDGDSIGVAARRFGAAGDPVGDDFAVNSYTTGMQGRPDVAVHANGEFVVAWQGFDSCCYGYCVKQGKGCTQSEVSVQRFDAAGNAVGKEVQANDYTARRQGAVSLSLSPTQGFVVAWDGEGRDDDSGIFARRFDPSGVPLAREFRVNARPVGYQIRASAAHDARGALLVTWEDAQQDVLGRRLDPWGARSNDFVINAYTTGRQGSPSVSCDAEGNCVAVWTADNHQDGSGDGVFGRQFNGLSAADSQPEEQ